MSHIVILTGVTAKHWGEPVRVVSLYTENGVRMAECYPPDEKPDAGEPHPVEVPVAELVFETRRADLTRM
jgi:hypothetical protein